jgi:hypothetical protein
MEHPALIRSVSELRVGAAPLMRKVVSVATTDRVSWGLQRATDKEQRAGPNMSRESYRNVMFPSFPPVLKMTEVRRGNECCRITRNTDGRYRS